jgi:hypothetical protein
MVPGANHGGGDQKGTVMSTATAWPDDRRITIRDLQAATDRGERWSMLTSYDTLTAGVFEQAGVRALLVGDTSAELVLGYPDTLPVTMDQLVPMVQAVVRGTRTALVVADLPFGSYQAGPQAALPSAVRHRPPAAVRQALRRPPRHPARRRAPLRHGGRWSALPRPGAQLHLIRWGGIGAPAQAYLLRAVQRPGHVGAQGARDGADRGGRVHH